MSFDHIKTREQMEKPVAEGGMSMGEGRKLRPMGKCEPSPDGQHHYTSISCVQSVEHFVCDHCRNDFYD